MKRQGPPPSPMLAREYSRISSSSSGSGSGAIAHKRWLVQPKLDGVRMVATFDGAGGVSLCSRNGNDFGHLAELFVPDIARLARAGGLAAASVLALDGELYAHGSDFSDVVSMVKRRSDSSAATARLQYHVFDAIDDPPTRPFAARQTLLREAFSRTNSARSPRVQLVEELGVASSQHELDAMLRDAERRGYEGLILRDPAARYEQGRRSAGLLKVKRFDTAEFRIVSVREAQGQERRTPVLVCELPGGGGGTFSARVAGTLELRREMFRRRAELPGRWLTVQFQGRSKQGVPRFPVGLGVRDYE